MTRPKIEWTDEELAKAENVAQAEQRKRQDFFAWHRGFLAALGAVHPAECREREREAATFGAKLSRSTGKKCYSVSDVMQDGINARYPSLLPQTPPALVLSTGTWVRPSKHAWQCDQPHGHDYYSAPRTYTASDARALAAWLAQYGSDDERK